MTGQQVRLKKKWLDDQGQRIVVNGSYSVWRLVSCGVLQEFVLFNSFISVVEEECVLLNAEHPRLERQGQYAREQGCYPERPRLAGGMSPQEPHEGQMRSPTLGKE